MQKPLLISVFSFAASAVMAAEPPVTLSAGEHEGYSRIVVNGGGPDLSIETMGQIVRIHHINADAPIDLSDINIGQKALRIDSARRLNDTILELKLNCACSVQTARADGGRIIIDVADAISARAEPASSNAQPSVETSARAKTTAKDDALTVEQAHDRMMELLQQAAADGLISLKDSDAKPAAAVSQADGGPQPLVPTQADATNASSLADTPPAKSDSPADNPIQTASSTAPPQDIRQCLGDNVLTINGADFDDDPLAEIERLQTLVADTSGAEKDAVLRRLANGFLSIGFGEEALSALKNKEQSAPALYELAQTVAEIPLDPKGVILGAQNCTGAHALWQAIATDGGAAADHYQRAGGAIEMLPARLKNLLATRLAVKMTDNEAWDAAQELLTIAAADKEKLPPELKYVETLLADHSAENQSSRASLLEIATNESVASDEALLALADSYVKLGDEPHDGFLEDIGALAKVGGSSRAVFFEAYSWATIGNFDAAMLLLKNEASKPSKDASLAATTADAMITRALTSRDPLSRRAALDAYLTHIDWIDADQSRTGLRTLAADFAFEVGLPNLSYELLSDLAGPMDRKMTAKIAQAALAAGNAKAAIKFAAPYASEPAFAEILVRANIEEKNYDAALATAAAVSDDNMKARLKARSGWLARNWEAAVEGFRNTDPNTLDEASAIRYVLSAYLNGATTMPAAADAILASGSSVVQAGLNNLFTDAPAGGPRLQQSRSLSETTAREIRAFEELLNDG